MEKINPSIEESWKQHLEDEFSKPYFLELKQFWLKRRKSSGFFLPDP